MFYGVGEGGEELGEFRDDDRGDDGDDGGDDEEDYKIGEDGSEAVLGLATDETVDFGGERMMAKRAGISGAEIEEEIKTIDETFQPDDITLSKTISCVWETSI